MLCLWTGAACNAVFGLDELRPGDGDGGRDGGGGRRATFTRDRLTASSATVEDRPPAAVRYLVRDPAQPLGYAVHPAAIAGATATADSLDGPYLLEVSFDGVAPLYIASDAAQLVYRDRVYGRADLDTVVAAGTTVTFSMGSSRWENDSVLAFDTFGMWSHAHDGAGPVTGGGAMPVVWNLPWSLDAVTPPPGAPLGLLAPGDHVAITHREAAGSSGGWSVTEGHTAAVDSAQGQTLVYEGRLNAVTPARLDVPITGDPLGRAAARAPRTAACVGAAEVRAVPWATVGNRWGVGLGRSLLGAGVSVGYGSDLALPAGYAPHLITTVECAYPLGGSMVAVRGEHAIELPTGTRPAEVPLPFAERFEVGATPLNEATTNIVPLPTGAVTVRWMPEPGLPAPDLYSVVVAAVGGGAPAPVFTALTGQPSIDVPAGLIAPGSYVVIVTAASGYPGFRTGDLTPRGPGGSTTTPSPLVVITTP